MLASSNCQHLSRSSNASSFGNQQNINKYKSQLRQIEIEIWTNKICNLRKVLKVIFWHTGFPWCKIAACFEGFCIFCVCCIFVCFLRRCWFVCGQVFGGAGVAWWRMMRVGREAIDTIIRNLSKDKIKDKIWLTLLLWNRHNYQKSQQR